jgi:hypothetical protein
MAIVNINGHGVSSLSGHHNQQVLRVSMGPVAPGQIGGPLNAVSKPPTNVMQNNQPYSQGPISNPQMPSAGGLQGNNQFAPSSRINQSGRGGVPLKPQPVRGINIKY